MAKFDKERRISVFKKLMQAAKMDSLQGTFQQISSKNYEDFLKKVGCGPLSLTMVMRAKIKLTILKVRFLINTKNDIML